MSPLQTDLQVQVREAAAHSDIPIAQSLLKMHNDGATFAADVAAGHCVAFLRSAKFGRAATEDVYAILKESN